MKAAENGDVPEVIKQSEMRKAMNDPRNHLDRNDPDYHKLKYGEKRQKTIKSCGLGGTTDELNHYIQRPVRKADNRSVANVMPLDYRTYIP